MYGLTRPPFANIPDPSFLYPSVQHQRATSILKYALMARAGFCVITGDIGAGKTTLVRSVLKDLNMPVCAGLVSNTQCESFDELLRWILLAYDLDYRNKDKVEMYDQFVQFLVAQFQKGEPVTLIIDEAQNLSLELLEQLRMLSNVNTEKGQILQTILVGQPELWDLLRDPSMIQFAQRISYDYFLKPLDGTKDVQQYIQHRLKIAGGATDLFEQSAYQRICEATSGVPRLINLLCDTALVYAYADESKQVSKKIVEQVITDKHASFAMRSQGIVTSPEPSTEESSTKTELDPVAPTPIDSPTSQRPAASGVSAGHRSISTIEKAALRLKPRKN